MVKKCKNSFIIINFIENMSFKLISDALKVSMKLHNSLHIMYMYNVHVYIDELDVYTCTVDDRVGFLE